MLRKAALGFAVAAAALALSSGRSVDTTSAAGGLRPLDPVVMTGSEVPSLAGEAPGDIVAFKHDGSWQQIPVQVDERAMKDFGSIYGGAPNGIQHRQYVDTGTFTGGDPDPLLDADDEIVFMARDAGDEGPITAPAGTLAESAVKVTVTDPLSSATEYVYLFVHDGSLDPAAGQSYVDYDFTLLSGPYPTTYDTVDGPNPEDSTITTANYERHFGDRWLDDELRITTSGATGVDILDRHKALFAPGVCQRSEDTFDDAEGAFVINKSGPVRAIRSYVGANSGPLTQREHVFYEGRQDVRTFLRVHQIPSVMDFFDYAPAASGMSYHNNLNTGGVTIDGVADSVTAGTIAWELVRGVQGSLAMSFLLHTDIPNLTPSSYYLDDDTPGVTQCTGDAFAYGASGIYIQQSIPNTDPAAQPFFTFTGERLIYYLPPNAAVSVAQEHDAFARAPLEVSAQAVFLDEDGDGIAAVDDNCPSVANADQADGDSDLLGDDCEAMHSTNPDIADSDGDGCLDGREARIATFTPAQGGDRDPASPWDFFDVPAPALLPDSTSGVRNGSVSISDVLAILPYVGVAEGGGPATTGASYNSDLNDNGTPDGEEYDRTPSVVPGKPWRSGPPNGSVGIPDALVALAQSGHACS